MLDQIFMRQEGDRMTTEAVILIVVGTLLVGLGYFAIQTLGRLRQIMSKL